MAITEDRVEETATLADLLQRVEALEARSGAKQIKKKNKMTIIAWGGNLDRIWPTTILATTAAASGMEASVFFTFWGLFAIVKPGVRITGDNWMQKMMSVMNPGSAQKGEALALPVPRRRAARCSRSWPTNNNVAKPDELITLAQELGVRLIPCQMTMDLLGLKRRGPARRARGADRGRDRDPRDARGRDPAVHLSRARLSPSARRCQPHVVDRGLAEFGRDRVHEVGRPPPAIVARPRR